MNKQALSSAAHENDPRKTSHGHRRRAEGGRGIRAPPSHLASPLISLCVPALCLSSCVALGTRPSWCDGWAALSCHVVPPCAWLAGGLGCNHCPLVLWLLGYLVPLPSPSFPGMPFEKRVFPHHSFTPGIEEKGDKGLHGMAPFPLHIKALRLSPGPCWVRGCSPAPFRQPGRGRGQGLSHSVTWPRSVV